VYIYFLGASRAYQQIYLLHKIEKKIICDSVGVDDENVDNEMMVVIITTIIWDIQYPWKR
jgi:hypothetical protein